MAAAVICIFTPRSICANLRLKKNQHYRLDITVCYCSLHDECWSKTKTMEAPKENSCKLVENQLVSD